MRDWLSTTHEQTLLSGGLSFPPGFSTVQQVDPRTGQIAPRIGRLSSAIDVIPLGNLCRDNGFLSLEFNPAFPAPGVG